METGMAMGEQRQRSKEGWGAHKRGALQPYLHVITHEEIHGEKPDRSSAQKIMEHGVHTQPRTHGDVRGLPAMRGINA